MEKTLIETALRSASPLFDAGRYNAQQAAEIVRNFLGDVQAAAAIANRVKVVLVDETQHMEVQYA